jgi:quercetin dioxygenase-like cupin family protein
MKESYGTLSETINGLKNEGYTLDFNISPDFVQGDKPNRTLSSQDFVIDKFYRFEGETNPDDQAILYAITSTKFNLKGVLVNGYGISSNQEYNTLISKLSTNPSQIFNSDSIKNVHYYDRAIDATALRPEGDRVLDAPLVEMDLNNFIVQIKNEITWATTDHNSITILKSDNTTVVLIGIHKNAELKKHKAYGAIHVQVLEGKINFCTEQQTVSLQRGQMIALKADIPHSVLALEDSFFLLTVFVTGSSL